MMTLPNMLTIGRLCLIPVYLLVYFSGAPSSKPIAFGVLLLAGLTDVLDGYLARKYKLQSEIGGWLDPLADKLMMLTVIASQVLSGTIGVWSAAVFFIRDAGMIVGSAACKLRSKKIVTANQFGKTTTCLFYVAFFLIFFEIPAAELILWCVIALSFVSTAKYVAEYRKVNLLQYEP